MGDRAVITFKSGNSYSPGVYLHHNGGKVADWLKEAAPLLRRGDDSYAAARFVGFCHSKIRGVTGLGLIDGPTPEEIKNLKLYSPGDAGAFVVDIDSGEVRTGGGYGEPFQIDPNLFSED